MYVSKYPNILGTDVAGEVVEVGSDVKRIIKGQRVISHCFGIASGKPENAGFQLYTVTKEILVAPLPGTVGFEQGVVLPLAISTAAAGLYQNSHLGLPYPEKGRKSSGRIVLVWGGSSSVGATAIQLAAASGLIIATTCSSKHAEFVKSLGAKHVFDHTTSNVVNEIVSFLKDKDLAGIYDSISLSSTFKTEMEIASKLDQRVKIATVLPPPKNDVPTNVEFAGVFAPTVATEHSEVGDAVWRKYVPDALTEGRLLAKPDPIVVGKGLEKVQEGLDRQKAGVSAGKIVISLE